MGRKRRRTTKTCNICFDEAPELKCIECVFEVCYKCITKWANTSHKCPLCGQLETYDIDYPQVISSDDEYWSGTIFINITPITLITPITPITLPPPQSLEE